MKSPKFVMHGTASEKDAVGIEAVGFVGEEGRANISSDWLQAWKYATKKERSSSKSDTAVADDEVGRIIILAVPDELAVGYSTHTDITIDHEQKEISGYTSKHGSGRKQLAFYTETNTQQRKKVLETLKSQHGNVPEVSLNRQEVLMSILPTPELGEIIDEIGRRVHNLEPIDIDQTVDRLVAVILSNTENSITQGVDARQIVSTLLDTTIESQVINTLRGCANNVANILGYTIINRKGIREEKEPIDAEKMREELLRAQQIITQDKVTYGKEHLNRYLRKHIVWLLEQLNDARV